MGRAAAAMGWIRSTLERELVELGRAVHPELCWLCRERAAVDGFGCEEHALLASALDPDEARCRGCAARLPEGIEHGLCAACRRTPRGYGRLFAAGAYERAALREWLLAFKHGARRDLARPLAHFLARRWGTEADPLAVLVPVPLHPWRRVERGYDQARLLAEELGEILGLRVERWLRRARWTPPQGSAGAGTRSANVAGAFAWRRGACARARGLSVWLVDDVVTSGATARACAAVLRQARPLGIGVLALARVEAGAEGRGAPALDSESLP